MGSTCNDIYNIYIYIYIYRERERERERIREITLILLRWHIEGSVSMV